MNSDPHALQQKFTEFLKFLKQYGCSSNTLKSYGATFRRFSKRQSVVNNATVKNFLRKYDNLGTRNKVLCHLKSFAQWNGQDNHFVEQFNLRSVKIPDKMPVVISDEDSSALIADLLTENKRAWAVASIMRYTGMRIGEVMNLTTKHLVVKDDGTVCVKFTGKGSKEREVPLTPAAQEAATYWTSLRPKPSEDTIRRAIKRSEEKLGLSHIKPHYFRSTIASKLVNNGQSFEDVAELLGHRNTDILRAKYARLNHKSLKKLVESAFAE